jgi:hypothetical protein
MSNRSALGSLVGLAVGVAIVDRILDNRRRKKSKKRRYLLDWRLD